MTEGSIGPQEIAIASGNMPQEKLEQKATDLKASDAQARQNESQVTSPGPQAPEFHLEDISDTAGLNLPQGQEGSSRAVLRPGETAEDRIKQETELAEKTAGFKKQLDPEGTILGKSVGEAVGELAEKQALLDGGGAPPTEAATEQARKKIWDMIDAMVQIVPNLNKGGSMDDFLAAFLEFSHYGAFRSGGRLDAGWGRETDPEGAVSDSELWHNKLKGDPALMVDAAKAMYEKGLQKRVNEVLLQAAKTDPDKFVEMMKEFDKDVLQHGPHGANPKWQEAQKGLAFFYTDGADTSTQFTRKVYEMFQSFSDKNTLANYYDQFKESKADEKNSPLTTPVAA